MAKVKIGFNRKPVAAQISRARLILGKMTDNDNYPEPKPALSVVKTATDKLEDAYNGSRNGDLIIMYEMKKCRKELLRLVNMLGAYVQVASDGNETIILSSGFDVQGKRTNVPDTAGQVFGLKLKDGSVNGKVLAGWSAADYAIMYIVKVSLSADFSNPKEVGNTTTTQKEFGDYQPGTKIWVSVFAYGREKAGDPSAVVSFIVR